MQRLAAALAITLLGALIAAGTGEALSIECPTTDFASCAGTLTYEPGTGIVEVHVTNTGQGVFTAFGLETPGNVVATAIRTDLGSDDWDLCSGGCGLGKTWDVAAKWGEWIHGGETLDLFIQLSGPGLASLHAEDFVSAANATGTCGAVGGTWGCVHVQSIPGLAGSSTKIPIREVRPPAAPAAMIPEPATFVVLASGLVGLTAWAVRKRYR